MLANGIELSFDHAAPRFTATSAPFKALLQEWQAAGHAAPWPGAGEDAWVGTPSANSICRMLSSRLAEAGGTLLFGRHVRTTTHDTITGQWTVSATNRAGGATETHTFDALVFSDKLLLLPNPYAVLSADNWGELALPTALSSTGAVVLMLALEQPPSTAHPPLLETAAQPPLRLLVHDSSKPLRPEAQTADGRPLDLWVAHSTHEYAIAHLSGDDPPTLDDPEAVLAEMKAAALAALAPHCEAADLENGPTVAYADAFVWDHAQTAEGSRLRKTHLLDASRMAGVCGDFFAGDADVPYDGVEAAAMSGIALAEALAAALRSCSDK